MTIRIVDPRPDSPPPGEVIAEVVARMLDSGDRLRSEYSWEGDRPRVGWLSLLVADARLLARLVPGADLAMLDDVYGRLWPVCSPARRILGLAEAAFASLDENLLERADLSAVTAFVLDGRLAESTNTAELRALLWQEYVARVKLWEHIDSVEIAGCRS